MALRDELVRYLDERLNVHGIDDFSKNGLQVEGCKEVTKIGLATDAALEVYQKAIDAGCQMLLTHHGLIWKGISRVTGRDYQHVKVLINNEMNLYAAHLPLDLHPEIGNNALLASLIGLEDIEPFGEYHGIHIGVMGNLPSEMPLDSLAEQLQSKIGGQPKLLGFGPAQIKTVGIVSGGGGTMLEEAAARKIDCYITGEGSHPNYHLAQESGLNVIYAGHYHTETIGVQAVGKELADKFQVETVFLDVPSPF